MAEAAKTVKYHVSDFLKDRHPYNRDQSFETLRQRDAGKVFNGFDRLGIDELMINVVSPQIDTEQRAISLRHLLAHSASAEKKVGMLRKQVVQMLAGLMNQGEPVPSVVESLVHQLLRSLSIIPQGCVAVLSEGGLGVLLHAIASKEGGQERQEARIHAAAALSQVVNNYAGRAWLLGEGNPTDFELVSHNHSNMTDAQREEAPTEVIETLVRVLESPDAIQQSRVMRPVAHALASLASVTSGLHKMLIAGVLRVVSKLLHHYASGDDAWLHADNGIEVDVVLHMATIVWHSGLDPVGLKEALELDTLLLSLGLIARSVNRLPPTTHYALRSALAGAIGSLCLHPALKERSLQPLAAGHETDTVIDIVIASLQAADALAAVLVTARKTSQPPPFLNPTEQDVIAIIKNCVQTVRLIAELPAGRTLLHARLPNNDASTEKVRRMVFFSTPWQDEYGVYVY